MTVAPEGRPFIAAAMLVLVVLSLVGWWRGTWWTLAAVFWLPVAVWVAMFFRDPPRPGPRSDQLVLAPADGRVTSIVSLNEPDFIKGPATRISVFMNIFDVHVNRHPVSGLVVHREYRPGKFINATLEKASVDNERMSLGVRTSRGPVLIQQIAGLIARRIATDPAIGDTVAQGSRLGLIRFGSRVDTFVPASVHVSVQIGEHTKAGVTIIAEWSQ